MEEHMEHWSVKFTSNSKVSELKLFLLLIFVFGGLFHYVGRALATRDLSFILITEIRFELEQSAYTLQ